MTSPDAAMVSPLAGSRERLWPVVAVSILLHVGAITAAVLHRPAPVIDLAQKPIMAKLVRLGQKRPENFLPRKEAEPPPAPAAAAAPVPIPGAPAAPDPKAHAAARPAPATPKPGTGKSTGKTDPLSSVLNRMRREQALSEPAYGDPSGDPEGNASEASEGDRYLALVDRALHDSYRLPATISEKDRLYLKATVVLFIESDGTVSRYVFEKRSGNTTFDDALERAIRQARLPPPPPEIRSRMRQVGLGVQYHM